MSYGPHGIVRVGGKVHFVRHVVPGDEIELRVREDHGSYAYADLTGVIAAGSGRRVPPCPYLPRCGGCPWQQIEYAGQVTAKEATVRETLRRIGGLADPPVRPMLRASHEFGYRRRLSLRVEGRVVGYFAGASHDLVPVSDCLLGTPSLRAAIPLAQTWIADLQTKVKRLEIVASAEGDGVVLVAEAEGGFIRGDGAVTRSFLASCERVTGIALRGRQWRREWGDHRVTVRLGDGTEVEVHAGNFLQVNASENDALLYVVLQYAAPSSSHRVLDLYAGTGNLSLPLARLAGHVTAVESALASTADGAANAERLGLANVSFITAVAAATVRDWAAEGRLADTVILDPPRGGAADVVPELLRLAPARIVYVSCNPTTLARDVRSMAPAYRAAAVQPIDFFPQTYHVESVALLLPEGV